MKLRSGREYYGDTPYNVILDFDYASEMWMKNKVSIGGGLFKYKINLCN